MNVKGIIEVKKGNENMPRHKENIGNDASKSAR